MTSHLFCQVKIKPPIRAVQDFNSWRSMILLRITIYKFQQNYKQTILSMLIFLANIVSCDTNRIAPRY